eukprot:TRINITY_DN17638_c0_g1_i1.p1 TRINITY_DN17638_c0_g1~~TRINITY_DN17638_c0_g1_i1.p1  ORF type:complete len:1041 (-),score=113.25 TRINITY_DN17638_c0_g1_i1:202-3294(-)
MEFTQNSSTSDHATRAITNDTEVTRSFATRRSRPPLRLLRRKREHVSSSVCPATCPRTDFATMFGSAARVRKLLHEAQCPWVVDNESISSPQEDCYSLGCWANRTIRDFFGGRSSKGVENAESDVSPENVTEEKAENASTSFDEKFKPSIVKRSPHTCSRAEPFWQCDAHNAAYWTEVWRRVGIPLAAKLNRKAVLSSSSTTNQSAANDPQIAASRDNVGNVSGSRDTFVSESGEINITTNVDTGESSASTQASSRESPTELWQYCADEGEICLCVGDVRFGSNNSWAPEVLTVRSGLVGCIPGIFNAADRTASGNDYQVRGCECRAVAPKPLLVIPGRDTAPARETEESAQRTANADESATGKTIGSSFSSERFIKGTRYPDHFMNGVSFDYASVGAGARIVTHAKGMRNAKAILTSDKETYMLAPCESRPWFVLSLLEDLFLEHVGLVSLELYASGFRHVQILGSSSYPTLEWRLLGELETSPVSRYEAFDIGSRCRRKKDACWVRFIKVRVLSHHHLEENSFCALTRLQMFGSTQITYLAEARNKEDEVDRRVEPLLADVVAWSDAAVRAALTGPFVPAPSESSGSATSQQPETADPPELGVVVRDSTAPENVEGIGEPPHPSEMLNFFFNKSAYFQSPQGSAGVGSLSATLGSLIAALRPLRRGSPFPASADVDIRNWVDGTQASKPAKSSSSSTPQLVRMHNDLRAVQEDQALLQETIQSLASGLSAAVSAVAEAVTEQRTRVSNLEETQGNTWWYSEFLGSMRIREPQEEVNPHGTGLIAVIRRLVGACSFDRLVLFLLVAWNVIRSRRLPFRGRWRSSGSPHAALPQPPEGMMSPMDLSPATHPDNQGVAVLQELRQAVREQLPDQGTEPRRPRLLLQPTIHKHRLSARARRERGPRPPPLAELEDAADADNEPLHSDSLPPDEQGYEAWRPAAGAHLFSASSSAVSSPLSPQSPRSPHSPRSGFFTAMSTPPLASAVPMATHSKRLKPLKRSSSMARRHVVLRHRCFPTTDSGSPHSSGHAS